MKKYIIMAVAIISLTACEYHELTEVDINGNHYTFPEKNIIAYYQTQSTFTSSTVLATDSADTSPTSVRVTVNSNFKGTYNCPNGASPSAEIFVTYDGDQFSTANAGSSGSIELLTSGSNLIEGTFSGTLKNSSNTYTISVSNGKFSGRAY